MPSLDDTVARMLPDSIPVAMTVAPATATLAEFLMIPTMVPDDTLTAGGGLTAGAGAWSAITGKAQDIMAAETRTVRRQACIFIKVVPSLFRALKSTAAATPPHWSREAPELSGASAGVA